MFAYEGLGCIYWHMISKLMLAAQEFALMADGDLHHRLTTQRGLGFRNHHRITTPSRPIGSSSNPT
jgi:hypothetical protein